MKTGLLSNDEKKVNGCCLNEIPGIAYLSKKVRDACFRKIPFFNSSRGA